MCSDNIVKYILVSLWFYFLKKKLEISLFPLSVGESAMPYTDCPVYFIIFSDKYSCFLSLHPFGNILIFSEKAIFLVSMA